MFMKIKSVLEKSISTMLAVVLGACERTPAPHEQFPTVEVVSPAPAMVPPVSSDDREIRLRQESSGRVSARPTGGAMELLKQLGNLEANREGGIADVTRHLHPGSAAEVELLTRLTAELTPNSAAETAEAILGQAQGIDAVEVLSLTEWAMSHPEPSVRSSGLSLLAGADGNRVWQRLVASLRDPDEGVRLTALEVAHSLDAPARKDFLRKAILNDQPEIRQSAYDLAADDEEDTASLIRDLALGSNDPDLTTRALMDLQVKAAPRDIPKIIQQMDSASPVVADFARVVLQSWLGREFATSKGAKSWWEINQARFGPDLVENHLPVAGR
jgi:hypothetical protein